MTRSASALRRPGRREAIVTGTLLLLIIALQVLAPFLGLPDPEATDLAGILQAPSVAHPLGTDELGRDLLSRVVHGGRSALAVTAITCAVAAFVAVALAFAGALGPRWVDGVIARIGDAQLALPTIVVAVVLLTFVGNSAVVLVLVMVLGTWVGIFRIVRADVRARVLQPYIDAARVAGAGRLSVAGRHLLPAVAPVFLIAITASASGVLISLSGLNYLGLGVQPPTPDWGTMVAAGQARLAAAPWLALFPGAALALTIFVLQRLGDALAELLLQRGRVLARGEGDA